MSGYPFDSRGDPYDENGETDDWCAPKTYRPFPPDTRRFWNHSNVYAHLCKECGTKGLHWRNTQGFCRLYTDGGDRHVCGSDQQQPTLAALQEFSKSWRSRGERLSGLEDYE